MHQRQNPHHQTFCLLAKTGSTADDNDAATEHCKICKNLLLICQHGTVCFEGGVERSQLCNRAISHLLTQIKTTHCHVLLQRNEQHSRDQVQKAEAIKWSVCLKDLHRAEYPAVEMHPSPNSWWLNVQMFKRDESRVS